MQNDYPREHLQVLVFDGESTDGTREVVKQISSEYPCIELHSNSFKTAPYGFNMGIQHARGEYITILSAHAEVSQNWIRTILSTYNRVSDAVGVGGKIESLGFGYSGTAIALAVSNPFGVGNSSFRVGKKEGYADTVVFGTYKRETFDKYGLFDTEMARNQDDELNYRIRSKGGKLFFDPQISTRYFVRNSVSNLYRQYAQYGFWKPLVYKKCKGLFSFRQLVPPVFVVIIFILGLGSFFSTVSLIMLMAVVSLYLFVSTVFATRACETGINDTLKYLPVMPLLFLTIHFSYGLNFIAGLFYFSVLKLRPKSRHQLITR